MSQLTNTDRELILSLRSEKILDDVLGHSLKLDNGVIIVTCSDGDQIPDVFRFQGKIGKDQKSDERIHTIALNGGALDIPENSPISTDGESKVILKHIGQAIELKNINTVILYGHAPCGAAGLCNLSAEQTFDLLIEAKTKVKEVYPQVTVACFYHVDYGQGKKRTYFLSRDKYKEWKQKT